MAIGAGWYINNRGRRPESTAEVDQWIERKAEMSRQSKAKRDEDYIRRFRDIDPYKAHKNPKPWLRPITDVEVCEKAATGWFKAHNAFDYGADKSAVLPFCTGVHFRRSNAESYAKELRKRFGDRNVQIVDGRKDLRKAYQQAIAIRKKNPEKVVVIKGKKKTELFTTFALGSAALLGGVWMAGGSGGATAAATAGGQQAATAGAATKAATTAATKATATTAVKGGLATKAAGGAAAAGLSKVVQDKPVKPHVVRQLEEATEVVDAIGALYQSTTYAASPRRPEGRPINRAVEPDSGSDIFLRRAGAGEAGDKGLPLVMIGGIAAVIAAVMLT